jgi:hypothetical protein
VAGLVLPTVTCVALGLAVGAPMSDWPIAAHAGDLMLSDGFTVYARSPEAQMGPAALLLAATVPAWAYAPLVGSLLLPFLFVVMATAVRKPGPAVLAGAMTLALPWAALGVQGHGDDALLLLGIAVAVHGQTRRSDLLTSGGLVLAVAAKPLALMFLPLLLLRSPRSAALGVAGTVLVWAPFVLADPVGFLAAGEGYSDILPGSALALAGMEPMSGFPPWVRPAQLGAGLALCWWVARSRGWAAAVLAVFVVRTLLEPATWNYYSTTLIAAAFMVEVRGGRQALALTVPALATFVTSAAYFEPMPAAVGLLRLALLGGLLAGALLPPPKAGRSAELGCPDHRGQRRGPLRGQHLLDRERPS